MVWRIRMFAMCALFLAGTALLTSQLGQSGLVLAAIGAALGLVLGIYSGIPSQYRAMMDRRRGKEREYWNWKIGVAMVLGMFIVPSVLVRFGDEVKIGFAIMASSFMAAAFLAMGLSAKLARAASEPSRERPVSNDSDTGHPSGYSRQHDNRKRKTRRRD